MNTKKILIVFLGIVLLVISIFTVYISAFIQPKIDFKAEVSKISEEDYKRILSNNQVMFQDKGIERFRYVSVEIKVKELIEGINRVKIVRDQLNQYIKFDDKTQILGGGSFEHGNGKEYAENIEVYLVSISEEELRSILKDFRYKVIWYDFQGNENSKIFYLRDYLE